MTEFLPSQGFKRKAQLSLFLFLLACGQAAAAEPVPDFRLANVNKNSERGTNRVSPRDYIQQVSGYYFGAAT